MYSKGQIGMPVESTTAKLSKNIMAMVKNATNVHTPDEELVHAGIQAT
jgi:hypothetical protein